MDSGLDPTVLDDEEQWKIRPNFDPTVEWVVD